jgi:hypothetical protein
MLKGMNYPPGKLDGRWGGMTAEALAGFINDRNGHAIHQMTPPGSKTQFEAVKHEIKDELTIANAEGFKRPVSPERANPTKKKVDEVAPEAAPVRRNFLTTALGCHRAFGCRSTPRSSDWIGDVWNFFTDNEDKVPDTVKDPSWLWSHLAAVPPGVWFVAHRAWCWASSPSTAGRRCTRWSTTSRRGCASDTPAHAVSSHAAGLEAHHYRHHRLTTGRSLCGLAHSRLSQRIRAAIAAIARQDAKAIEAATACSRRCR